MHLTCPSCAAVYEIPDGSLRPGRRAHCAHCGTTWSLAESDMAASLDTDLALADAVPEERTGESPAPPSTHDPVTDDLGTDRSDIPPDSGTEAPVPIALPAGPTAMDRLATQAPQRQRLGLRAAWVASILLLAGSAAAAAIWRADLAAAWPPAARILGGAAPLASGIDAAHPGPGHPGPGHPAPPASADTPHH